MTRPRSLLFHIVLWLLAAVTLGISLTAVLLYWQFRTDNSLTRLQTLRGQSDLLEEALRIAPGGRLTLALPARSADLFKAYSTHYDVLDGQDGRIILASAATGQALWPLKMQQSANSRSTGIWPFRQKSNREVFFVNNSLDGGEMHYGLSRIIVLNRHPYLVQVASTDREMLLDSVVEEYFIHIGWFWLPFTLLLLGVNILAIHHGLAPLRHASHLAEAIGPQGLGERLPLAGMPREIIPLVAAVNGAFGRIEAAYNAQRDFLADVTHELRTPLAVMKAHLSLLDDKAGARDLVADLDQLERLVLQLLDAARLDVLRIGDQDQADLTALAREVAEYLAPLALRRNRSIALTAPDWPVPVRGIEDVLFRALRNVVENALTHTPPGSEVRITVRQPAAIVIEDQGPGIAEEDRTALFTRFWQKRRDRRSGKRRGAGLGLAIVARTMEEHGGRVEVDRSETGGARFTLVFPECEQPYCL